MRSRYGFPTTLSELAQEDEIRETVRKSRKVCRMNRRINKGVSL